MSVCTTYAEYNGDKGYRPKYCDVIQKTLDERTRWIPVSERLPKNDDWAIVTILDERGDTPFRYTDFGWYLEAANCWIVEAEQRTDVTAWMPLPDPWRGEE